MARVLPCDDAAPLAMGGLPWDAAQRPAMLHFVNWLLRRRRRPGRQAVRPPERDGGDEHALVAQGWRLFEKAAARAGIGMWECELPNERLHWSGGTHDLFGLPRDRMPTRPETLRRYTEESLAILTVTRGRAIEAQTGFELESEIVTPQGLRRWIKITASLEAIEGQPARLFGFKRDVTRERRALDAAWQLINHDALTGLASRARLEATLLDFVARGAGSLLLIDLDDFKRINDVAGHAAGDECLKRVAERLCRAAPGAELVARLGGDEFAVLVGPGCPAAVVELIGAGIVSAVQLPMECEGEVFSVGASVGIAAVAGSSLDTYRRADRALYSAKRSGGRRLAWADAPAHGATARRPARA